jgi:hypothetical protein
MSTFSSHDLNSVALSPSAPVKRYSRLVKFIDEVAKCEPHEASTTVDIYSDDNNEWYCQVCRGGQKTQAMGPYSKRQAERVQDARRTRLATRGTTWLIFEKTGEGESHKSD